MPEECPGDIRCAEGRCEWPKCAAAAAINTWCEACGARYGIGHDEWHAANVDARWGEVF